MIDKISTDMKAEDTLDSLTTHRPWGCFTNLLEGDGYKVKRIVVNPGGILSLQLHRHRSEHWIVVKGRARVTIASETTVVEENQSVFIPISAVHRVENCEALPLEIVEVQCGDYLGEDDIVRLEDIYGRAADCGKEESL
jgi:mannose-6-phosphate isomerase-like protein (cupin superfamily)